jgi:hypothetical protein
MEIKLIEFFAGLQYLLFRWFQLIDTLISWLPVIYVTSNSLVETKNNKRSDVFLCFVYLQTVPACQNLYKNSFTYHCLQDDKILQFDDAIQFLGESDFMNYQLAGVTFTVHQVLDSLYVS